MSNKFRTIAIPVMVLLATAVSVTLARGEDRSGVDDREAIRTVAPQLPTLIAAFRREQTDRDRRFRESSPEGIEVGDLRPGETPQYTRRLGAGVGPGLYAWPARGEVCLSIGSSGGCASTELLARRGVLVGTRFLAETAANQGVIRQAFVLARDGIDEVEIRTDDGHSVVADIQNNGVVVDLSADVVSARWRNVDDTPGEQTLAQP